MATGTKEHSLVKLLPKWGIFSSAHCQEPFQNKGFKDLSHTVPSVNESNSFAGSGVLQKKKRVNVYDVFSVEGRSIWEL